MHLSTSNSNDRLPKGLHKRQWLLFIFLLIATVFFSEIYLRMCRCKPSVKDTSSLWSYWRDKCEDEDTSDYVVTLGASRIQIGFVPEVFKEKVVCDNTIVLAKVGANFIPALEDIALNSEYKGTVICSIMSQFFFTNSEEKVFTEILPDIIEYYHKDYSKRKYYTNLSTVTKSVLEDNLVLSRIYSLKQLFGTLSNPVRSAVVMNSDRSLNAYYREYFTKEELEKKAKHSYSESFKINALACEQDFSYEELIQRRDIWMENINRAWKFASIIEKRGGKVVFVRYPTTGMFWEVDQELFPKDLFWDYAAEQSKFVMIHFKDIPEATHLDCPDTVHLNHEDADIFTSLLADKLISIGVMKPK